MTSTGMAEELGITRETVGRYMGGNVKVPVAIVKVWAMVTDIDYDWLQDGTTPESPQRKSPARKPRSR